MYSQASIVYIEKLVQLTNTIGCIAIKFSSKDSDSKARLSLDKHFHTKLKIHICLDLAFYLVLIWTIFLDRNFPDILDEWLVLKYYVYLAALSFVFQFLIDVAISNRMKLINETMNAYFKYMDQLSMTYKRKDRPAQDRCSAQLKKLYVVSILGVSTELIISLFYLVPAGYLVKTYAIRGIGPFLVGFIPDWFFIFLGMLFFIGNFIGVLSLGLRFNYVVTLLICGLYYGGEVLNSVSEIAQNPRKQSEFVLAYRKVQILFLLLDATLDTYSTVLGLIAVLGQIVCGIVGFDFDADLGVQVRLLMLYSFVSLNLVCAVSMRGAGKLTDETGEMIQKFPTNQNPANIPYVERFRKSCRPIQIVLNFEITLDNPCVLEMNQFVGEKIIDYSLTFQ